MGAGPEAGQEAETGRYKPGARARQEIHNGAVCEFQPTSVALLSHPTCAVPVSNTKNKTGNMSNI